VLIVINGPIASGKSTLARAVARKMRSLGANAAWVDVDLLYDMLAAAVGAPKSDERSWRLAREAAAALTDTFLDGGMDAVLVEGRFFAEERAEFLRAVHSDVVPRFVTLRTSYDEALRRAQADTTRGASRDPAFLRPYFAGVERDMGSVPDTDLVLDTESLDLERCVAEVIGFVRRSS
jgi:adenylylsulfate kinase-like enzyme